MPKYGTKNMFVTIRSIGLIHITHPILNTYHMLKNATNIIFAQIFNSEIKNRRNGGRSDLLTKGGNET